MMKKLTININLQDLFLNLWKSGKVYIYTTDSSLLSAWFNFELDMAGYKKQKLGCNNTFAQYCIYN